MQAYIGEIIPVSTTYWRKNISLVVCFAGCDFKCPFCYTPELVCFKEEFLIDVKEVKRQLEEHAPYVESIFFTGGEPCLQRQALFELASFARSLNLKVGLDTNGSKPHVIREMIEKGLVDFVNCDIKCAFDDKIFAKATDSVTFFMPASSVIDNIKETITILRNSNIDVEVTTPIIPTISVRKEDLLEIAGYIKDLNAVWNHVRFDNTKELLDKKRMSGINPPSDKFMEMMKESIIKRFPQMHIELHTS